MVSPVQRTPTQPAAPSGTETACGLCSKAFSSKRTYTDARIHDKHATQKVGWSKFAVVSKGSVQINFPTPQAPVNSNGLFGTQKIDGHTR